MSTLKSNTVSAKDVNTDLILKGDGTGGVVLTGLASQTPAANGDIIVERTANTTLTFKLKGTDGTVRTGTLTLS